jgi:hypothetical protein
MSRTTVRVGEVRFRVYPQDHAQKYARCWMQPHWHSIVWPRHGRQCTVTRHAHPVITTDAEIDAAIARAERRPPHAAVAAAYDSSDDVVAITFADGIQLRIPRRLIQGLRSGSTRQLANVKIEGPGTGLVWSDLDVAHYVPGLVAGLLGTRQWMAEIGRRGGVRKTKAKARAARANGAKGGRPRKR